MRDIIDRSLPAVGGQRTMAVIGPIPIFLVRSDSASRKRPFSTGLLFDWIRLVLLLIVSRVEYIFFVLVLEAVGVRSTAVQQAKSVGSSVLRAFSASNGSTNLRRSELMALGLAESRQSYVLGVTLSREPPKVQQAQPLLAASDRAPGVKVHIRATFLEFHVNSIVYNPCRTREQTESPPNGWVGVRIRVRVTVRVRVKVVSGVGLVWAA